MSFRRPPLLAAALAAAVLWGGCGRDEPVSLRTPIAGFGTAPATPAGELEPATKAAVDALVGGALEGGPDAASLETVAGSGDPRLGWLLSDLLRFNADLTVEDDLLDAFAALTGTDVRESRSFAGSGWLAVTNHLIAWDLPAPPGYRELKGLIFTGLEPGWAAFFADADSDIDWRLLSWGGVLIDDRPLGDPDQCERGCIPALDDPGLTDAESGDWYPDSETVFGVVVGGEAVAFPKNVMEVHEMVNITIGGRRLGIPYCTLCGSAQAYFLDAVPAAVEQPVLRSSGLLSRSNKVMYDLRSHSVLDTFTGEALSGPLHDAGVKLEPATVEVSTWGDWKGAHPDTRIIAEDGGIGREYPADPLGGRDDSGPIFPVGDVDPRLSAQEQVLGVSNASGDPIAFPVEAARQALAAGKPVRAGGVEVTTEGAGLLARAADGRELPAHQAFWFAWSQFNPRTSLWEPGP